MTKSQETLCGKLHGKHFIRVKLDDCLSVTSQLLNGSGSESNQTQGKNPRWWIVSAERGEHGCDFPKRFGEHQAKSRGLPTSS